MLDFAAWTLRASAFLRRLTRLPGAIDICDQIEPPVTDQYDLGWLESDECGIPHEIRRFIATASKRCAFSYTWTPSPGSRLAASDVVPNRAAWQGGGDLCEEAKYRNYANRDWFRDNLDPLFASFGLGEARKTSHIVDVMAEEQSCGRVPIMELEDRQGAISLCQQATDGGWVVVYVERIGDPNSQVLSPSFEQFLLDWEATCYRD